MIIINDPKMNVFRAFHEGFMRVKNDPKMNVSGEVS
jgi:hypothetical protein